MRKSGRCGEVGWVGGDGVGEVGGTPEKKSAHTLHKPPTQYTRLPHIIQFHHTLHTSTTPNTALPHISDYLKQKQTLNVLSLHTIFCGGGEEPGQGACRTGTSEVTKMLLGISRQ